MNIDPEKFKEYMVQKEAFLKIYECSNGAGYGVTLTGDECKKLLELFEVDKVMPFIV